MSSSSSSRRVVVTGIGAITPLGRTFASTYASLLALNHTSAAAAAAAAASSPFRSLADSAPASERDLMLTLPCKVCAPVPPPSSQEPPSKWRSRFIQFAVAAAADAVSSASLPVSPSTGDSLGVSIGTGIGSIRDITAAYMTLTTQSHKKLSPHFVPSVLCNSAAGAVSITFHAKGPSLSVSTACATGAHAIGDAYRVIQRGEASVMLAGGTESCIDPLSVAGFTRLRALSEGADLAASSRPFDKQRDGFVMAEGACVLVLEDLQHALDRKANILAEITGYGATGDAHHVTAPDPLGLGAVRAMNRALSSASLTPSDVDYVNAHATSTPLGDAAEVRAVETVMAGRAKAGKGPVPISSTKGATGHLLGAAGALEAAFAVMTVKDDIVPHTLNLKEVDVGQYENVRFIVNEPEKVGVKNALSNSFGFGGSNACLIFSKFVA